MEKQMLTPGRWRGLKRTSHNRDVFGILAFDQRGTFTKMLPQETTFEQAVALKQEIVTRLSQGTSAVLLDFVYGIRPALEMSSSAGLLMVLEKSGFSGDSTARTMEFQEGWNLQKIKSMGAEAVKVLVYYNPKVESASKETDEFVTRVIKEAHALDMPVFLEPLSYSSNSKYEKESAEFAEERSEIVIETVKRLGKLGPDILKLEFPLDIRYDGDRGSWKTHCDKITAASPVPWVLLSAGVDFKDFMEQLQVAVDAGASGYLAGRAIWKEAVSMNNSDRARFLDSEASDRVEKLNSVVIDHARPWTDFYDYPSLTNDWYKSYQTET